jgi:hypothetical protein
MYRLDMTLPVIDIFDGAKAEDNEIYAPGYLQCKLRVIEAGYDNVCLINPEAAYMSILTWRSYKLTLGNKRGIDNFRPIGRITKLLLLGSSHGELHSLL